MLLQSSTRAELAELQAAGNPFSPPPQSYHRQLPATASCQSQSYGLLPVRSAMPRYQQSPPSALYAYQAPLPQQTQTENDEHAVARRDRAPIVLRRLRLNPSLRTRTVARLLFAYWASCSPYARLAKPLGMLSRRACHWRKRVPSAFGRWRSWSRSRSTRLVAFFGKQLQRRRAVTMLAAAWRRWRANAMAVSACRALDQGAAAHRQQHTRLSTARRRLLVWRCAAVRWRAAREVAARVRASQLGLAMRCWRRLCAGCAACNTWLRNRRLRRCMRAVRAWRRGELARAQRAREHKGRVLAHWRCRATAGAWCAWAARIVARASSEEAQQRCRLRRLGWAWARYSGEASRRAALWSSRAVQHWQRQNERAALRSWRRRAEAGSRLHDVAAAAAATTRRWRLHDAAAALAVWAKVARPRRLVLLALQSRVQRESSAALRLWRWVHGVETQAILQLRAMARAVALWRATQARRAWRRWLSVTRALRVAGAVGVRWRKPNAWRALHCWLKWAAADRTAERLLTSAGVRWRTSGRGKALSHWAGLMEARRRLCVACARKRSRELRRALQCWRERAAVCLTAERLLTSAGVRWRASARGDAFAHWRDRARSQSAAWSGAAQAACSWRRATQANGWRTWREASEESEDRKATRRALATIVQQWLRREQAVAWRAWRAASEERLRLFRLLASRLDPRRKGMARVWAAWVEASTLAVRAEMLVRLREATILLRREGRALRVWQRNAASVSSVCEGRLRLAARRWRHVIKLRAWSSLREMVQERARLLQAFGTAGRRWFLHLVAAALRAWRENGALWQRVLLELGRRAARDDQRRGLRTWRALTATKREVVCTVRAVIARWRQRRLASLLGGWRRRALERRELSTTRRTVVARWLAKAVWSSFVAWRESTWLKIDAVRALLRIVTRWRRRQVWRGFAQWSEVVQNHRGRVQRIRRSIGHWCSGELAMAWHTWRGASEARGAARRALATAVQLWCRGKQAEAWRTWFGASEARLARSQQMRSVAMRWLYQRASFALTSWRERTDAALRAYAALGEWCLPRRAMRSYWLWWVASVRRGRPDLVAVRWRRARARVLQGAVLAWRMMHVEADTLGALAVACGLRRSALNLSRAWQRWQPQAPRWRRTHGAAGRALVRWQRLSLARATRQMYGHAKQRRWVCKLQSRGLLAAQHAAWAGWRSFWRLVRSNAFVAARTDRSSAEIACACARAIRQLRHHAECWRRWLCASRRSDDRRAASALCLWRRRTALSSLGGRGERAL